MPDGYFLPVAATVGAPIRESGASQPPTSPRAVRKIDWADRLIRLDVDRQKVKDGPPYNPSVTVDGAYEEKLLTYYGIGWVAG